MKNQLPVRVSESYYWNEDEEMFYHNEIVWTKWGRCYKDKSTIFNDHKYQTIITYKTATLKDEYKSYNVAVPQRVEVDRVTIELN